MDHYFKTLDLYKRREIPGSVKKLVDDKI
jgi:hypothetical protein